MRPTQIRRSLARWSWLLLGLACLLLPSMAFAQSGPYTVSDDDLSKKVFLDYLFGPLTGSGTSPLTSVVLILNSAILFLGGVFMAYTVIAGTMSTAHDGEMLGKKWSSLWLPIRTTLGAAAVMPVIGGGWCAAQAIVIWLATLGIGIANAMWGGYVQNGNILTSALYNPPTMTRQIVQLYGQMLISNVCVEAYSQAHSQATSQNADAAKLDSDVYNQYTVSIPQQSGNAVTVFKYGTAEQAQDLYGTPTCGQVQFPAVNATPPNNTSSDPGSAYGGWSSVGTAMINANQIDAQIIATQNQTIQSAQSDLAALAKKIVTSGGDAATDASLANQVSSKLQSLALAYNAASAKTAQAQYKDAVNQNFLDTMTKDGWVMAGAFYMEISRAQDNLTEAISTTPTSSDTWSSHIDNEAKGDPSWWNKVQDFFGAGVPDLVTQSMGRTLKMVSSVQSQTMGGVASITTSSSSGTSDKIISAFTGSYSNPGIFQSQAGNQDGWTQNPILMAKNFGNSLVNWAWAAFAIMAGIGLFTLGGAGVGTFTIIAGPFTMLFGTLLVGGATMAFYLPMLPYILWIGVVLGWAVLLIEAVIAAPIWAVVHMAPDGDGVVGRGGQGYMLVLSLTLRPPLMVMGLVASISLMQPIGYLINSTFGGAFAIAQGPGYIGLTGMIAGAAIYCGVMVSVVNRVFSLIHVVPDRLLRWIGGGGNELGSEATALDQGSAGKMVAATGAASQLGQQAQGMLSGARQLNQGKIQAKEAREGKLAQERGNIGDSVSRADKAASQSMDAADRGDAMDGPGEKTANKYAHARSEAQSARSEALSGAESMASNMVQAQAPGAEAAQEFLDELGAAREAANAGDKGAMSKFVEKQGQAARASLDEGRTLSPTQQLMSKAYLNQQRIQVAEEKMTYASSIDEARQAGASSASDPDERPDL